MLKINIKDGKYKNQERGGLIPLYLKVDVEISLF